MIVIGVDVHKHSLTAVAVDEVGRVHAVAVGLHSLVAMDDGPAAAMEEARAAGAAILAANPHDFEPTPAIPFPTRYFAERRRRVRP